MINANDSHHSPSAPAVVPFASTAGTNDARKNTWRPRRDDEREDAACRGASEVQPDPPWFPGEHGRDGAGPPLGTGDGRAGEHPAEQQEQRRDDHGAVAIAGVPPVGEHRGVGAFSDVELGDRLAAASP